MDSTYVLDTLHQATHESGTTSQRWFTLSQILT